MTALEKNYERPGSHYAACDVQRFAYQMCARNMTRKYASKACADEIHDMFECMTIKKRAARADKLAKASDKVGDVIPRLYNNRSWVY